MHRRLCRVFAAGIALVALSSTTSHAQLGLVGFKLGASAGLSLPTGDTGDRFGSGYNVNLLLGLEPPLSPLGFRVEGGFNQFSGKDDSNILVTVRGRDLTVYNLTANAMLNLPGLVIRPYLIGGVGGYWSRVEGQRRDGSKIGFNVGGGVRWSLSGFGAAVEARYHRVTNDNGAVQGDATSFIPVAFVLTF